ncbi:hypothetical protein [Agrobacterium sp. NPDC089420]|uniref:hypothetical protein n=1 Tax=Agrobacterium sp. NPDC089420 TaxID=3363918 RepID=UPI00384C27EC
MQNTESGEKAGKSGNHAGRSQCKPSFDERSGTLSEATPPTTAWQELRQRWLGQALFVSALDEIVDSSLPDESPASKLKQLGMMVYVMDLVGEGKPITLTALVESGGLARSAVGEIMDKLVERGCLAESMGKNTWGRGKARQFNIGDAILGALQRQASCQ